MSLFSRIYQFFDRSPEKPVQHHLMQSTYQPEPIQRYFESILLQKPFILDKALKEIKQLSSGDKDNFKELLLLLTEPPPKVTAQSRNDILLRLIMILHKLLFHKDFQTHLVDHILCGQIKWLTSSEASISERLQTEQSTSSFIPCVSYQNQNQQIPQRSLTPDKQKDLDSSFQNRRRNKILDQQQSRIQYQSKPAEFLVNQAYIQMIAGNFDIFSAVLSGQQPQIKESQQQQTFLCLYKIENLMNIGLKLLEFVYLSRLDSQCLIYQDLLLMQNFSIMKNEEMLVNFKNFSTQEILSFQEIFTQTMIQQERMQIFFNECSRFRQLQLPKELATQKSVISDFKTHILKIQIQQNQKIKNTINQENSKNFSNASIRKQQQEYRCLKNKELNENQSD